MASPLFVRNEMLPSLPPPARESGVVKWLRENLFSSALNSVLTVLAGLAVLWLASFILPWLAHGVWNASSVAECREKVAASFGPDAAGPCWAVIRLRWNQFLFGLYPQAEYWRPTTAAALLMVSLSPVLYYGLRRAALNITVTMTVLLVLALIGLGTDWLHIAISVAIMLALAAVASVAPKRLLWLTLLFPFIAFFLIWGGPVWTAVGALAGFVIFAGVWFLAQKSVGVVVGAGIALVVASLWWTSLQGTVTGALATALPWGLPYVVSDNIGGFLLAFVIGITAISASLPIGVLLALGRRSDMPLIHSLSVGFIEFFRGVPLITVLFAANFLLLYFLPPRTNFDLILRVIIVVIIFASAYIAEVIRGGLAALPRGQYEAADALGLDYWQAQRLIIMPQALKISIPGIVSSFIGLFKDTTLVALVGLMDPLQGVTKIVRSDNAWKGIYWEPYIFVGGIFFIVCFSMSRYSMYLERKLKTDHR